MDMRVYVCICRCVHSSCGSWYSTHAGMTEGLVLDMEAKERMQGMLEHAEGTWPSRMEKSLPVALRHLQVQTLGTGDINMQQKGAC